jgi:hypothetical protein
MKRPFEPDYISHVAYTRALEEYCDTLVHPQEQRININPIPFSGFFHTPTLSELQESIESMPQKDRALVYMFVQQALNACHAMVEDEFVINLSRP